MSLTRTLPTVLAMALLATGGLAPTARAEAPTPPESAVVVEEGGLPALSPAEAEGIRAHAARAMAAQPADLRPDTSVTSVNPVVSRHFGMDRYATAAALARAKWRDVLWADIDGAPYPFHKVVFIASGHTFPDALSGGALAAYYGGPMLLTRQDGLHGATRTVLNELKPDYVVVLGGHSAVSDTVVQQLAQYVPAPQRVVRFGGSDRYEVSVNIARDIMTDGLGRRAYVALGTNWPDGMAGAAAAGTDWSPLLLTRKDSVPAAVLNTLAQFPPEQIVLLGGSTAVSDRVVQQLAAVAPVVRVGGSDRYAVAANAARLHPTRYGATIASGQSWPDALAGSAYAGLMGDKLLLVRADGVPAATRQVVSDQALAMIDALGGLSAIQEPVLNTLRTMSIRTPG